MAQQFKRSADIQNTELKKIVLRSQAAQQSAGGVVWTWYSAAPSFASNPKVWKLRQANIPLPASQVAASLDDPGFTGNQIDISLPMAQTAGGIGLNDLIAGPTGNLFYGQASGPALTALLVDPGFVMDATALNQYLYTLSSSINTMITQRCANSAYSVYFQYQFFVNTSGRLGVNIAVIQNGSGIYLPAPNVAAIWQIQFTAVNGGSQTAINNFFGLPSTGILSINAGPVYDSTVAAFLYDAYAPYGFAPNPMSIFATVPPSAPAAVVPYLAKISIGDYGGENPFIVDSDGGSKGYQVMMQGATKLVYTSDTTEDMQKCVTNELNRINFSLYDQFDNPIILTSPFMIQLMVEEVVEGYGGNTRQRITYET